MIALPEYRGDAAVREKSQGELTYTMLPPSLEQGFSRSTLVEHH
jgi:hypothetical protein